MHSLDKLWLSLEAKERPQSAFYVARPQLLGLCVVPLPKGQLTVQLPSMASPSGWSDERVAALLDGVQRHGVGNWSKMLVDSELSSLRIFKRTQLRDKWRNLSKTAKVHSTRPMKTFTMVQEDGTPLLSLSGRSFKFRNRTPRDAALKAASRSQAYTDAAASEKAVIRLVEEREPAVVYSFSAARSRVTAPAISKFSNRPYAWRATVHRIR